MEVIEKHQSGTPDLIERFQWVTRPEPNPQTWAFLVDQGIDIYQRNDLGRSPIAIVSGSIDGCASAERLQYMA